ncbi:hypothetical protein [Acanthopleuribacter pedis]|uniref:Uncharacterized protein n=1 Tax=Acanthopleuribacter pedis TaxID=442870 RepID=A0A8J7Q881_9BACT|nr:hypothetical protein [Acanthopleuribacter pedis]MBO1317372.1 hypothetical protein [Acanthopleuribacter pedis]MBO1318679.1 hypothetical protein [Acanthopleuribacter pedis]
MAQSLDLSALDTYIDANQDLLPGLAELFSFGNAVPMDVRNCLDGLSSRDHYDAVLRRMQRGLSVPDVYIAAHHAMLMGAVVERGGDPDLAVEGVLDRLTEMLPAWRRALGILDQHCFIQHSSAMTDHKLQVLARVDWEAAKTLLGVSCMVPAAMAMVTRSKAARIAARRRTGLIAAVAEMERADYHAFYIHETLAAVDDMRLLVLHGGQGRGAWVRLDMVRNAFQLFTLLQGTLVEEGIVAGPQPNAALVACARGLSVARDPAALMDRAVWGYLPWYAARADGGLDGLAFVPGEVRPDGIARYEDHAVLLLDAPLMARTWDGHFFAPYHDALRPNVIVESVLTPEEVALWMKRFAAS